LEISKTLQGSTSKRKKMWLKKLKTVSAEPMKSAPSGERGKNGIALSDLFGAPPPACRRRSLLPFPGFVIGHSQIIEARRASCPIETPHIKP
jgi:hypothetical protein